MRLTLIAAMLAGLGTAAVLSGIGSKAVVLSVLDAAFVVACAALAREVMRWDWPVLRLRRRVKPAVVEARFVLNDRVSAVLGRIATRMEDAAKRHAQTKESDDAD